ncbi:MAG: endonuclease domain-containing protein [Candidatus Faecousia sp.]|nr:endonuclease domain-containing protein [Candidatus Faecousia sp.]
MAVLAWIEIAFVLFQKEIKRYDQKMKLIKGVLCDLRFCAVPKPPLCKGRWHGGSRDGGIVMQPKHNKQLVPLAKQLRKEMTKEERHLWYDFLRSYPVRFSRQKVLGKYIADFYSAEAKLVIELDGSQHYEDRNVKKDADRTAFLEAYGLRVIRIPNNEVSGNFRGVCEYIDAAVKQSLSQLR